MGRTRIMNLNKYTLKAQETIQKALELAQSGNNQALEPAHILKAFLIDGENVVVNLLNKLGANLRAVEEVVDAELGRLPKVQDIEPGRQRPKEKSLIKKRNAER